MSQRILIGIFVALACVQPAFADPPSVTAVLSNSEATVGETVELQIKVTGPGDARPPEEISIDGLEIHSTGTSRQFEIHNFSTSSSVTYNYTILPLRAGRFTIPPQTVLAGGKALRTPALSLNVADSPGQPATTQPSRGAQAKTTGARDLVFAELIVPKKTAYVGEIVPVQIRMGFDARVHPRLVEPPEITGQGFTAQKLQQSSQNLETIGGRPFEVVTFKTAIAAARTGKFEIGPVKAKAQVVVPRRRSAPRARSPFDLFEDDPFSDPFFSNPFAGFGERRDISISSDPVALEVKPLPPNAPPSFSGAIGSFTMATDAKPKSVQVGDPITVTTNIAGRGNFDRVNAPVIEDERGWHKYPPSSKFKQDDEVGISGTKTFETVLSPNEKKQTLPVLAFSYFDPAKEQYVTLHSEPMAIAVQGGAAATQGMAANQPASTPPTAKRTAPSVQQASKPQDILYQLTEPSRTVKSFQPIYTDRVFWVAQSIPLAALLVFAGWQVRRTRRDNRQARRIASLQHEASALMHKLRRDAPPPREYYAEASRVVQLKAALASADRGIDPNAVDAETAAETFKLDADSRDRLRRLFEQNDEWQYSGTHNGPGKISPENRRDVLELIENLKP